jgi:hypothetical protein
VKIYGILFFSLFFLCTDAFERKCAQKKSGVYLMRYEKQVEDHLKLNLKFENDLFNSVIAHREDEMLYLSHKGELPQSFYQYKDMVEKKVKVREREQQALLEQRLRRRFQYWCVVTITLAHISGIM